MKIEYYITLIEDTFGNKDYAVYMETCDTVQICGITNAIK